MDQVHLPDPVLEDLLFLKKENSALAERVAQLEKELKGGQQAALPENE